MHPDERQKIMRVHMIGPKVADRLAAAGFHKLTDFAEFTGVELYARIRLSIEPHWMEKPHKMAVACLENLIQAAKAEAGKADDDVFPNPFEGD